MHLLFLSLKHERSEENVLPEFWPQASQEVTSYGKLDKHKTESD